MLKLTEAELAEIGFSYSPFCTSWMKRLGEYTLTCANSGDWGVRSFMGSAFFNLHFKEDLLTLIRLFTPPQPPERLPDNHCYNCDGTGGDCAVDCKHCKGTGAKDG